MHLDLIDIGVNLAHGRFRSDLPQVIERAQAAGVQRMIATGTSVQASLEARALAERYPGEIYATAGVHPHHARLWDGSVAETLRELAASASVVAIGECGLDYDRDFSPRDAQRRAFAAQLALSGAVGLPVFLHERAAHADFTAILREHAREVSVVVHCFTGERAELDAYLELGAYLGITGWICDDRRGVHLRELVRHIPRERLMIETDAPFLLPPSLRDAVRGRRNEPAYLTHVLEAVAKAVGAETVDVARSTTAAARSLFRLGER
jgi:TatD DNase family protein